MISIAIHMLILAAVLFAPLQDPKRPITQKTSTPITSYVYQSPPAAKNEVTIDAEIQSQKKPEAVAELPKQQESTQVIEDNDVSERVKNSEIKTPKAITSDVTPQSTNQINTIEPAKPQAKAAFNPYKSRSNFGEKLKQQVLADFNQQQLNGRGFSAMQKLPEPVSPSVYHKTELQLNNEATTQIGNETFVKRNGTCMQTTDLSNIDENLGSVTSFSDCGETDDEKYFREFMNKKMKKKGR
ncbi:hypothetical protein ND16A_2996 [Thalassotalea sp. ND16A]|nr:hypothetical protein ND16A_2996 [Thalassotalea sp. ND16A]